MRNKKYLIFAVAVIAAAALLLGGCSGGTGAVGILDVNKVMSDSPKVKQLQEQLNTKAKELSDTLEKDKASLSADEFQKKQEAAYGDFLKIKQDLEGQVDASIKQSVDAVAKEKKLGVVLYKNSVAQGGTDITDEVIKRMQ
ncbi:OmpH family outer membrane protein [Anaeroselena agilis]|uniref:OmpH family outer membrane protein n=1 Tax=Anaeroselena agilis TaxID=3063788 RepID=A0ABU3P434_9FIRM|nr:OmpH family outer membrane protein [Selenomonadales bacterium 4137-cl]